MSALLVLEVSLELSDLITILLEDCLVSLNVLLETLTVWNTTLSILHEDTLSSYNAVHREIDSICELLVSLKLILLFCYYVTE